MQELFALCGCLNINIWTFRNLFLASPSPFCRCLPPSREPSCGPCCPPHSQTWMWRTWRHSAWTIWWVYCPCCPPLSQTWKWRTWRHSAWNICWVFTTPVSRFSEPRGIWLQPEPSLWPSFSSSINFSLKGQCHKIFCNFFMSWLEAIWAPNKQAKMVLLKKSFSRRYSRKIRLPAVLACVESDSAQANSARSRHLKYP